MNFFMWGREGEVLILDIQDLEPQIESNSGMSSSPTENYEFMSPERGNKEFPILFSGFIAEN